MRRIRCQKITTRNVGGKSNHGIYCAWKLNWPTCASSDKFNEYQNHMSRTDRRSIGDIPDKQIAGIFDSSEPIGVVSNNNSNNAEVMKNNIEFYTLVAEDTLM